MSWRFLRALSCPARIIAAVSPLIPLVLVAGLVALVAGVLRPAHATGRATGSGGSWPSTPEVSVAEARDPGRRPAPLRPGQRPDRRRGRVRGRRPPAARLPPDPAPAPARRRLGRPSRTRRERVPFEVRDGLDAIAVDDAALDAGLVVVPRESVGTAADVADRVPAGTPPDDPGPAPDRAGLVGRARDRARGPGPRTPTRAAAALGRASAGRCPDHARAATRRCGS